MPCHGGHGSEHGRARWLEVARQNYARVRLRPAAAHVATLVVKLEGHALDGLAGQRHLPALARLGWQHGCARILPIPLEADPTALGRHARWAAAAVVQW